MGNMYQPERKRGNPNLNPPVYEGVHPTAMGLSNSVVIFFRHNMGHRVMHPMHFAGPVGFHLIMGYLSLRTTNVPDFVHQSGAAMISYAILMGRLSSYHERRGLVLAFQDPPLHSMARGESLLMPLCRKLHISNTTLQGVLEPMLALLFGIYVISTLHFYLLGWWFVLAAFSLMYVESVVRAHAVNAVFDLRDSHAEANFMMEVEDMTSEDKKSRKGNAAQAAGTNVATLSPELLRLKPGQMMVSRRRNG